MFRHRVCYHIFPIPSTLAKLFLLTYLFPTVLIQRNETQQEPVNPGSCAKWPLFHGVVNESLVTDHTIWQPGFDLPHRT